MNMYQQQILDEYHNPRNTGELENPTHQTKAENDHCGDYITVYLKVEDNMIQDVSYQAEGCSISIASASLLSEKIKGLSLNQLNELSDQDVLELMGIELTTARLKCALLPLQAFQKAISTGKQS